MKQLLEVKSNKVANWISESGLQVNTKKTEAILFSKRNYECTPIKILDEQIEFKDTIKVLGILFDNKMSWNAQIDSVIAKSKKSCFGLKHLCKFFSQEEMIKIATSLAYTKFYYGAAIWLGPMTTKNYKKRLKSASIHIIRTSLGLYDWNLNHNDLHEIAGRGTPDQISNYIHAMTLFDIMEHQIPETIWAQVVDKILVNERSDKIIIPSNNRTRIGLNSIANRLGFISNKIPLSLLGSERSTFKRWAKNNFITNPKS